MKQTIVTAFVLLTFVFVTSNAQQPQTKALRLSQFSSVSQTVGTTDITITYHRPGVKGREIWGKLVPFGEVWRSGANNATVFTFSDDVIIAGKQLKAGKYSFFTIPTGNDWTIIFNSVADQWGAYSYDSTKNILTFTVKPEAAPHEEWLSYSFSDLSVSSAKVSLRWEKIAVSFPITVDLQANLKKYEDNFTALAWQQAASYARYAYDSKTDWEKGMESVDRSIAINKNYSNMTLKAQLLAQKEKWSDAVKTGEEGLALGSKAGANTTNFEKQVKEWKEKLPAKKK
ncbi:MAG: DUF2911 domain-containing protein [Bacteroidota bacterium]|nr:DUF2911 domain-containing protein [Bacteroidota bacterium]